MITYQLSYGMKILFVGINPHPGSYRRGVPFSNTKTFWYFLYDAGLLEESRIELRDDKKLKELYENRFVDYYHFGFINLIYKPTRTIAQLKKQDALKGRKRIFTAIYKYRPCIVCFVGKTTYCLFIQRSQCSYGWQPTIGSSKVFVMHAPLHGPSEVRINELLVLKNAISQCS